MSVFAKCKRFENLLKSKGLTPDITYYAHSNTLDLGQEENATHCSVSVRDPELSAKLNQHGKEAGIWSVTAGIDITDKDIPEGDIPISLSSCGRAPAQASHVNLQDLVGRCDITELHPHNGNSTSIHLHVECKDSSYATLEALAEVVKDANNVGREYCSMSHARKKSLRMY